MNKITKNIITGVACLTLGAASFMTTRTVMQSQHVSATDPEKVEAEYVNDRLQNRIVNINLSKELTEKINALIDSSETVDQETLDGLSYYAIQYWIEGSYVLSEDNNSATLTSEDLLGKLLALYDRSKIEPSFKVQEDGSILTTRKLEKPKNYDDVVEEITDKAEEIIEEKISIDESDKSDDAEFEVKINVENELVE